MAVSAASRSIPGCRGLRAGGCLSRFQATSSARIGLQLPARTWPAAYSLMDRRRKVSNSAAVIGRTRSSLISETVEGPTPCLKLALHPSPGSTKPGLAEPALVVGSRQVRVAGIARTDRVCSAGRSAVRYRAFRRRWASIADETRCMMRSRLSSPRLRTGRSRGLRVMASSLPVPLSGPRQRTRARTLARSLRSRRSHRGGGITPVEVLYRPRSQNQ
jgi:hypothetical protein